MSDRTEMTETAESRPAAPGESAALVAVSGLMDERRRFEGWLAALEARRDTTPPHVFARVHADYTTRLEAVVGQLTGHGEELRGELASLTTRLAAASEEQQRARDERAEAELRAHVGELSVQEWETTAREADERIDALVSRHADVESEMLRTRELLSEAERPATPHLSTEAIRAAPEPSNASLSADTPPSLEAVGDSAEAAMHVPAADAGADTVGQSGSVTNADPGDGLPTEISASVLAAESELMDASASPPSAPAPRPSESFDELAFLNSVVDAAPDAVSRPAAPERPTTPPQRETMEFRNPDGGIENRDATADTSALGSPAREAPLAANISGNQPVVLNDRPSEGVRTLKCAECGAMNFPTEWYCERCGAELASL